MGSLPRQQIAGGGHGNSSLPAGLTASPTRRYAPLGGGYTPLGQSPSGSDDEGDEGAAATAAPVPSRQQLPQTLAFDMQQIPMKLTRVSEHGVADADARG